MTDQGPKTVRCGGRLCPHLTADSLSGEPGNLLRILNGETFEIRESRATWNTGWACFFAQVEIEKPTEIESGGVERLTRSCPHCTTSNPNIPLEDHSAAWVLPRGFSRRVHSQFQSRSECLRDVCAGFAGVVCALVCTVLQQQPARASTSPESCGRSIFAYHPADGTASLVAARFILQVPQSCL